MIDVGERTVTLESERQRLADKHDEVQRLQADADDSASAKAIHFSANELAQMGAAVDHLIEGEETAADADEDVFTGYGPDATVTVQGLTSGLYARVTDRVDSVRQQRDDVSSTRGLHRNIYAAGGLVNAPFFDRDAMAQEQTATEDHRSWKQLTERERLQAKIGVVEDLPPNVTKWLYSLVDDVTGVGTGNWKPSTEQRAADQQD